MRGDSESDPPKLHDNVRSGVPDISALAPLVRWWARTRLNQRQKKALTRPDNPSGNGNSRPVPATSPSQASPPQIPRAELSPTASGPPEAVSEEAHLDTQGTQVDLGEIPVESSDALGDHDGNTNAAAIPAAADTASGLVFTDSNTLSGGAVNMLPPPAAPSNGESSNTRGRVEDASAAEAPQVSSSVPSSPHPAVPSPPQPNRLIPTVAVEVPRSKLLDRVLSLRKESAQNINAREIRMSPRDTQRLATFASYVGPANQAALFRRQLPQCHVYLVEIEEAAAAPHVYICIEGDFSDADTSVFYSVMSQRSCRKFYHPWKLCFRRASVTKSAAQGMINIIVEGPPPGTLCGALLTTGSDSGLQTSTIGGLVNWGGRLVALTTAHHPDTAGGEETSSWSSSPAATLTAADFPEDVDQALVIVPDDSTWPKSAPAPMNLPSSGFAASWEVLADSRLVALPPAWILPNFIRSSPRSTSSEKAPAAEMRYITGMAHDPSGSPVIIQAGVSGQVAGTTSVNPSFLIGKDGPEEVWTVYLDAAGT